MFQSGVYNLANVNDGADFEWGIVPIPEGPEGRISVVNTVVVSGNADSDTPEETKEVLRWLGSTEGASFLGESGAAMPAVISAQDAFNKFWADQDVDPSQFVKQGNEASISAPSGCRQPLKQCAGKSSTRAAAIITLPDPGRRLGRSGRDLRAPAHVVDVVAVLELEASEDSSPDEHAEASRPTVATSATDASARVPAREELSHIFPILSPGKVSASPGGERSAAPYPAATAPGRSARCRTWGKTS